LNVLAGYKIHAKLGKRKDASFSRRRLKIYTPQLSSQMFLEEPGEHKDITHQVSK
jgi:hypothetical protein